MLNVQTHGQATSLPPLLIAHGLYGSGRNWGVLAKRLAKTRQVLTVDMRNHANSPWSDTHSYPDMAGDLAEVARTQAGPMDVLGHSMGGKAVMTLALLHPDLVNRLIVADIAPVAYTHSQTQMIEAMRAVDMAQVRNRSDALAQLGGIDPAVASFLLQSLDLPGKRWRLNLDVLEAEMDKIVGWPEIDAPPFARPTLFLSGAQSDYVLPAHRPAIRALFTAPKFAKIQKAGHWLHADQPRAVEQTVAAFFD